MDHSRDFVRERYEKNWDNHNKTNHNLKSNTYYEQIKSFNSKHYEFDNELTQINLDTPFRNHKKINEILHGEKKIQHELDLTRMFKTKNIRKCTIPVDEYMRIKTRENEKTAWR